MYGEAEKENSMDELEQHNKMETLLNKGKRSFTMHWLSCVLSSKRLTIQPTERNALELSQRHHIINNYNSS